MAGSISILGLGSTALNADTIDKLKEADKKILLGPANSRAEKNVKQREDFTTLIDSMKSLKSSASVFADELSYLKRSTSYTGSGGTVTAEDGVSPQKGQIVVNQLAQRSVVQSKGFATENDIISANGGEIMTLTLGPDKFEIELTSGMSIADLQEAIVQRTNGAIEASILNTGGTDPYSLVLKSKNTGSENEVTVSIDSETLDLGFTEIQKAQNAKFTYNSIAIERGSNVVNDLITGVKITLEQEGEKINFEVKQNLSEMSDKFEEFVKTYNETISLIGDLTDFDNETKVSGSFQGDTRVTAIRSSITGILFNLSPNNDTITDFGLDVSQDGPLIFDKAAFEAKMSEDPAAFESFFRGNTKVTEAVTVGNKVGYFNKEVTDIGTGITSTLSLPIEEDVKIGYGSVKINGVALPEITLLASNTPQQNTQLLVQKINALTNQTGVVASVSGGGDKVILTNKGGGEVSISDPTGDAIAYLGLSTSTVTGSREYSDGLFSDLDNYFEGLMVGEFSTLGLLESSLKNNTSRLDEEISKTMERINQKYTIMEAQFASYNSVIKQFESSFSSLQMQIDQSVASK